MPPPVSGYDELRLRIDSGPEGSYRVFAITDSATASGAFELPFEELELENFILRVSRSRGRRRIDASALGDAKRFGGPLFKALFREQVNGLYHDALTDARNRGHGLRITLCLSGAPALMDVPWEYLFDEPDFLAASAFTPVVRYLDLARGHRPLRVAPPLRVLGVVSSPADYEPLDVDREQANLARAVSGLTDSGQMDLHWLERPSLSSLLRELQRDTYHIFHYIGHGSYDERAEEGVLLFEDEQGRGRPVSGDKLGMVLHDFTSLRLAILNACEGARTARSDPFAGVAQALVRRDIPAVVAMQFEISDEAAIAFAGGFYEALATGASADTSMAAARLTMLAERSDDIEWGTPVLFMRVADGHLFELEGRGVGPVAPSDVLPEVPATPPIPTPVAAVRGDDEDRGNGDTPRRKHRWAWGIPALVVLAVALFLLLQSPSQSNASVAENWLKTFDTGNYAQAATYWRVPAFWTGLKGHTAPLANTTELLHQIRSSGKCHKLIEAIIVDDGNHSVRLRVYIDRSLPGRRCTAQGGVWNEDYLIDGGHIVALTFRAIPGASTGAKSPPGQTSSSQSESQAAITQGAGSGSGSSTPGEFSGGTSTAAATTSAASTPTGHPSTTTGTVPTPTTSTTP